MKQHIIISSLSLFSIDRLHLWWEASNQTSIFNTSIGNTSFIVTSNDKQELPLVASSDNSFYTCLGNFGSQDSLPCITFSSSTSLLRIDADPHGLLPVWFEIIDAVKSGSNFSFIVTTDYAVGRLASFSSLAAVGAGSSLTINMLTKEIEDISIPDVIRLNKAVKASFYSDISASFERAIRSSSTAATTGTTSIVAEYDALSFSSKLLHCWLADRQLYDVTFVPRVPLTIDYDLKVLFVDHPVLSPIIDFIPNDNHLSHLRNERPWQLFYEQYQLCFHHPDHKTVFSFHNYFEIDPLRMYFRSLLCSLLGITVIYPYVGIPSSHTYFHLSKSDFNMAVELQFHAGFCLGDPYETRSFVIDKDGVYTAVGPPAIQRKVMSPEEQVKATAFKHSTATNITVLLLATYGYYDMLHNFLCYAHTLFPEEQQSSSLPFIILTNDKGIEALANAFQAGVIYTQSSEEAVAGAEFGTVIYQQLILTRTKMALDLLELGFSPLIADIDTVWLRNPLSLPELNTVPQLNEYDLLIVNDGGEEVCGCFLLLHPTPNTIKFWSVVYTQHTQLVHDRLGKTDVFSDESEQKILTRLIYKREYQDGELKVYLLPASHFPDGNQFFAQWPSTVKVDEVYVVHNNFIISKEMKEVRFARYGLWQYTRPFDDLNHTFHGHKYCTSNTQNYAIFAATKRINYIKTVNIAKPVHNTITHTTDMAVCVVIEGFEENNFQIILNSHPRNTEESLSMRSSFGLFTATIAKNQSQIWSLTFANPNSNLEDYIDISCGTDHFSIDYRDNVSLLQRAHEEIVSKYSHDRYWQQQQQADTVTATAAAVVTKTECLQLRYHIKILTMKRAQSLQRLLTSLANADYHDRHDINLEIFIDGLRHPDEEAALQQQAEVIQIANDFIWSHGMKTITIREKNYGLASQWFNAWIPVTNDELAFIFEDDLEVSPYYFTWASEAAERYYGCNLLQREKQQELFTKLRDSGNSVSDASVFDEIVHEYAGFPMMYGICLQRQYLAPNHSPYKMQVRNGHRPYLYSLVGSWGPLFFPFMWTAFHMWWEWNAGTAPITGSLITNQFLQGNPGIWTPYLVRFAYEFGVKCLYANLPGNLTLVNNHREAGENYYQHMGPYARLLDGEILQYALADKARVKVEDMKSFEYRHQLDYHALQSAVNTWPTMAELSRWQIDFNLRRHGSYGSHSPFPKLVNDNYTAAVEWVEDVVAQHYHQVMSHTGVPKLTSTHWAEVVNLIESVLLPYEKVLCIEINPLMKILSASIQANYFLSSHSHVCDAVAIHSSFQCMEVSALTVYIDDDHIGMLALYPSLLSEKLVVNLPAGSEPVQYLLVIDACNTAPTIITIQYRYASTDAAVSSDTLVQYMAVEDVCDLHPVDYGAVLYRLQEDMYRIHGKDVGADNDIIPFIAISKRLSVGMTSRRMVDSNSNLFH